MHDLSGFLAAGFQRGSVTPAHRPRRLKMAVVRHFALNLVR
jgi:hypothetical protein